MRPIHRIAGGMTDFVDDARFAVRSLWRTPGLAALVVATLALGIGMTATPFSMLDTLLFRPYPVPHPSGVVSLVSTSHDGVPSAGVTVPEMSILAGATGRELAGCTLDERARIRPRRERPDGREMS
jgi:hypothetical protein